MPFASSTAKSMGHNKGLKPAAKDYVLSQFMLVDLHMLA